MEKTCENKETKNDLFVRVTATKSPKRRTPEDFPEKISMVAVEVNEEETDNYEKIDLNIHIQSVRKLKVTDAVIHKS